MPNGNHLLKNELILVTGASGKTGKAVMDAFLMKGYQVRALIHSPVKAHDLDKRISVLSGDLISKSDVSRAMADVTAVYHICPNMHPDEVSIGKRVIQAAKTNGVRHFVFHSVLHPQIKEMPHHWKKMQVEGLLFESGLNFTILQPAAYMQNLLQYKRGILEESVYSVPYNEQTRVGMVDLRDVAECTARIMTNSRYFGGIYELATNECYTQFELTEIFSRFCKKQINFIEIPRSGWKQSMIKSGMPDYAVTNLVKMFEYYEKYGFAGNGLVLESLLGRKSKSLDQFIKEHFTN